ncbi:MAG: Sec-dependent nitrous-oxide reductase [Melioribacteraceae bacterium]|nr:Sec-dependent nitrous-oxide reductase [Melioribacteraceae bacterium]MCF8354964.1 Sec-dependent nitrous-oxide reductase [Melioribacteraceae bacterium]MCF8394019.1 Sec-dependent nitrous-oxide reductase [Melioribacteraceae bacterium]MCF8419778.1 Sec-dependent nitrous-oxide reductase [Melioribacteraceae bacterium]
MKKISLIVSLAALIAISSALYNCAGPGDETGYADAAQKVYVAPGQYDEFYSFMSGGFNGQVSVYGLPSGRMFKSISVFSQNPETGYGYTPETTPMLETSYGMVPWDDAHHPELSQTDGIPDGRWLFINGNNTPRVARIDLRTFETAEILEIPNSAGNHGSPFVTMNTEYVIASTRFSLPIPQRDVAISSYKENFKGTLTFIRADNETGDMEIAFQILVPGFDYDLAHAGKGPSHGWAFFTSYNSEQANTLLEINASRNDKDFVAAVNWKKAEEYLKEGKGKRVKVDYTNNYYDEEEHQAHSEMRNEVTVIYPEDCPGLIYYLPTPKSPHGVDVDPSGEYIVAGGKLATVIPVHSFSKMLTAIENEEFEGDIDGIPILKYESVNAGEVENCGLGPLHTEFDGKGYAYTSAFISSEIVKWKIGTWEVVDRIPTYYSIGHLMIPGGDSKEPWGKYVVALNKITKDRYLPTGPELCQSAQLIDISGDKMKLLLDFPTVGEPHYAQAIPAEILMNNTKRFYELEKNKHPFKTGGEAEARAERTGSEIHIYMTASRTHFKPDNIEGVRVGDKVFFHVTNLEQDWDIPHGFAVKGALTSELLIMPGETKTLVWYPKKEGVFPFYCTDFCSALHQEMQGYIRVSPANSNAAVSYN